MFEKASERAPFFVYLKLYYPLTMQEGKILQCSYHLNWRRALNQQKQVQKSFVVSVHFCYFAH